jgi:mono/diheme cytochrome c family protein
MVEMFRQSERVCLIQKRLISFFAVLISLLLFSSEGSAAVEEGRHVFEHYCAVCHGVAGQGDGVNAATLDPHPSDLSGEEIASRSDQELIEVIEKGGIGVELSAAMPPWGKTFSKEQIKSLVTYIRILQKGAPAPKGIRLSDLKAMGKEQCVVCHIKGAKRQIAPDLSHEGSKFNRDWLYSFLKNPDRVRPIGFIPLTKTKMPNFNFSDEDADALTEFLMAQKEDRFSSSFLGTLDRSENAVSEGESLFTEVYGCDGCHKTSKEAGAAGGVVGPNLSVVAERLQPGWIYAWLKDPRAVRPDSPMPNFGLSDKEIRYLMAYVLSLGEGSTGAAPQSLRAEKVKAGQALLEKKNCLFCHILEVKK